jgi:hypothetical protein
MMISAPSLPRVVRNVEQKLEVLEQQEFVRLAPGGVNKNVVHDRGMGQRIVEFYLCNETIGKLTNLASATLVDTADAIERGYAIYSAYSTLKALVTLNPYALAFGRVTSAAADWLVDTLRTTAGRARIAYANAGQNGIILTMRQGVARVTHNYVGVRSQLQDRRIGREPRAYQLIHDRVPLFEFPNDPRGRIAELGITEPLQVVGRRSCAFDRGRYWLLLTGGGWIPAANARPSPSLNVAVSPFGRDAGVVQGDANRPLTIGQIAQLRAIPSPGWEFVGWYVYGLSDVATRQHRNASWSLTVNRGKVITAKFEPLEDSVPTPAPTPTPTPAGNSFVVPISDPRGFEVITVTADRQPLLRHRNIAYFSRLSPDGTTLVYDVYDYVVYIPKGTAVTVNVLLGYSQLADGTNTNDIRSFIVQRTRSNSEWISSVTSLLGWTQRAGWEISSPSVFTFTEPGYHTLIEHTQGMRIRHIRFYVVDNL